MLSRVLIVGRPNVGKSSLFNRLVQKRKALVFNQPGVTRDILRETVSWWGTSFEIEDSGGLWSASHPAIHKRSGSLSRLIDKKVCAAIKETDFLLFVTDARTGCMEEDKKTWRMIKKSGKPCLILVNKVDEEKNSSSLLAEFACFGVDCVPCAFEQDRGVAIAVEWIIRQIKQKSPVKSPPKSTLQPIRLLILGRPNVGKSLLCNAFLKEERVITSPLKGTTVDIVEDSFQYGSTLYQILDTAGYYRKEKQKTPVSLASVKMEQALKTADVLLLLVDATRFPGREDARLLELCHRQHKALIMVVNKWDLQKNTDKTMYRTRIQKKFVFYPHLPVVFISALKREGLEVLLKATHTLYQKMCFHIATSELNQFLMAATRKAPSPVSGVQDVKFYYFTQARRPPPHFIAFANYPKAISNAYRRFLIRQIQNHWSLKGVPIKLSFRGRRKS